jgi:hypothetical protein
VYHKIQWTQMKYINLKGHNSDLRQKSCVSCVPFLGAGNWIKWKYTRSTLTYINLCVHQFKFDLKSLFTCAFGAEKECKSWLTVHKDNMQKRERERERERGGCEWVVLEVELNGARFFKFQKIQILNFEKIQKNYHGVQHDFCYLCVDFYYEILCILPLVKITKY